VSYNKAYMEQVRKRLEALEAELVPVLLRLRIDALAAEYVSLQEQMAQSDFWQKSDAAQLSVKAAKLGRRIKPWQTLQKETEEALEMAGLSDEALVDELAMQLGHLEVKFEALKAELRFAGPHDDNDAIISIYAGAGGTDAQDWAGMLLRMYVRWAEKNGYNVQMIDESAGDEAGLKSVTLELSGTFTYGKLKGEHGVHRLVRLSPFNADSLRQTSFAKVDVLPKIDRPEDLQIDDKDLRIDVYRSGGHGGQSVNTTDSAVRVTHLPTGITVAIQNERSQLQNKETALTILRSRLVALQLEQHKERVEELKGPNQSAEWGNQIRSYVLHPYKQVKDLRTRYETSDIDGVLDGGIDPLIDAYLDFTLGK
jgi:peptide chain release factor 2